MNFIVWTEISTTMDKVTESHFPLRERASQILDSLAEHRSFSPKFRADR